MKKLLKNKEMLFRAVLLVVALIIGIVLAFATSIGIDKAVYVFCTIAVAGIIALRFFEKRKMDEYFWAENALLATFIAFATLGTFTSRLDLSFIAIAGMMIAVILLYCVRKRGTFLSEEDIAQRTWKKLAGRLAKLAPADARELLEEALRYKLADNKLDGVLDFHSPLNLKDGRALSYNESDEDGRRAIGAYIDNVIGVVDTDKDMEAK